MGRAQLIVEVPPDFDRMIRLAGGDEARTVALVDVAEERELGNRENLAVDVLEGKVHLAILIGEDAHARNLASGPSHLFLAIGIGHADEEDEALADGMGVRVIAGQEVSRPDLGRILEADLCRADTLNHDSHAFSLWTLVCP